MYILKPILLITSEFPPRPGGIGNHSYNLAKQLSSKGLKVCVIAPSINKTLDADFDNSQSFIIHRYSNNPYLKPLAIFLFIILDYLKNKKQILIASGQIPLIIACIYSRLIFTKCIAIFHGHEISLGNKIIKSLLEKLIGSFNQIIAVSTFSKNRALAINPLLKIKVINNGFDISRFKNKAININTDNLRLITLGSLSYRKGQHNVIKALPHILPYYNTIQYDMVGTPYIIKELQDLAKLLNVDNLVKFHGVLDDKDLNKLLLDSNIFIMLSDNLDNGDIEGYGIAILEANYLGLPAIGSKGCGIEDAISNGYNGELINNKNPEELILALDKIFAKYDNYSDNAIIWSKKHSWNIISDYYIDEINNLA